MDRKIKKQIAKAEKSGAYFVTITYRDSDKLRHWQLHTADFYYKDLLPSIDELKKLIHQKYIGLKYVTSVGDHSRA